MYREPVPQPAAVFLPEPFHYRLAPVSAEIVHHQMDGVGPWIAVRNLQQVIGELGRAAVRSSPHTMAMIRWLWPTSSARGFPGRGFSHSTWSSPSCSQRRAMALTVFAATPALLATCAAVCP